MFKTSWYPAASLHSLKRGQLDDLPFVKAPRDTRESVNMRSLRRHSLRSRAARFNAMTAIRSSPMLLCSSLRQPQRNTSDQRESLSQQAAALGGFSLTHFLSIFGVSGPTSSSTSSSAASICNRPAKDAAKASHRRGGYLDCAVVAGDGGLAVVGHVGRHGQPAQAVTHPAGC